MTVEAHSASSNGIVAVVVAYNRRDLLAQTLDGIAAQTLAPDAVLVVDNASTDDSGDVARSHPIGATVLTMPRNLGGAGGFAAGIAWSVTRMHARAVWIMDDDTIPEPAALEELERARRLYPGQVALVASRAVWTDGREHPMNTPRTRFAVSRTLRRHAATVGARQIRSASFVSVLIDARAVKESGLPVADYFLWNDDFEYTTRILRHRVGLYVPASRVLHATRTFGNSSANPGNRFYNEVRNKRWLFQRSESLNPLEKALYAGRTAVRWGVLLAGADNRLELIEAAKRGWRDAAHPPQATRDVLMATPVASAVEELS